MEEVVDHVDGGEHGGVFVGVCLNWFFLIGL